MAGKIAPLLASIFFSMFAMQMVDASVPAIFIFGDSTVDVGNNNFLATQARADYPPNGIDFVKAIPTGRFSNGLNTADYLSKLMGFEKSPPPFLSLNNIELRRYARKGINFASAGSGILEATGGKYGNHLSMEKQNEYYETVYLTLKTQMGTAATERLLSNSIFIISMGSNDLFESYLGKGPLNHTIKGHFIESLASDYEGQLRKLYKLGARKFGVISISQIGCCPSLRYLNATGGCIEDLNDSGKMLHQAIESKLKGLSFELQGFKYALGNSYEMYINTLDNPLQFGLKEVKSACCGGGKFNGEAPCLPSSTLCLNRDEYMFWDRYHPTQAASKLSAETLYGGPTRFVTPINFGQLSQQ